MYLRPYNNSYRLIAPDLSFAESDILGGVRQFHLTAEPVTRDLNNVVKLRSWGYDGSTPGPVLVAFEGETVRIKVTNKTSERTSVHWHGMIVPNQMDGVPEIGEGLYIEPGNTFTYEFPLLQSGTYMYHSHADPLQEMMGLVGMFIILPTSPLQVTRDYVLMLQEWAIKERTSEGNAAPDGTHETAKVDPTSMNFEYFTINGKMHPDTSPLRCRYGDRIRIRLGNLSMDSHPMHLHGHTFGLIATDGNPLPFPLLKDTINVAPGETWDIEFKANNPGNWALHCHKPHHITDIHQPKLGGMFTYLKYVG